MRARDIITTRVTAEEGSGAPTVCASASILDVLPALLDAERRVVEVRDGDVCLGYIDEKSLLEGFGKMLAPRDDSSLVIIETTPASYSASRIARAVEDADTHLVDLISAPAANDMIRVTLRVRSTDPSSVVNNLQRYDYNVVDAIGSDYRQSEVAFERLLGLRALLNV